MINYKFELCNDCHDITQKATYFNDTDAVSNNRNDYRFHFWGKSKDEAINFNLKKDKYYKISK